MINQNNLLIKNYFFSVFLITTIITLYHIVCETLVGRSLGKKLVGLKIVSSLSGQKLSISQIVIRNVFRIIDHGVFFGGLLIFTSRGQRIGDIVSKSSVVK